MTNTNQDTWFYVVGSYLCFLYKEINNLDSIQIK